MALPSPRKVRYLAALGATAALVMAAAPAMGLASGTPQSTWTTNGRVKAIVTAGGVNVIGGDFTTVTDTTGHTFPAQHLAVISASTGVVNRSWVGGTDDSVYGLSVFGNTVYVGGDFSKINGVAHRNFGAVSLSTGALVSSFAATTNAPVEAIAAVSGAVYVGGRFSSVTVGSTTTARSFVARVDPTSGAVVAGFNVHPDDKVRAIVTSGSTVYLGGYFTSVNGATNRSTVAVNGTTGALVSGYHGAQTNANQWAPAFGLDINGNNLYVAAAGGGGGCTALNATTGARIWTKHTNGNVQAIRYNNGIVYCGGHFGGDKAFDGLVRYKMGAVSATAPYNTLSYAPRFNSALGIWALSSDPSHLFVGGDFTKVTNKSANHYAAFADS